ncbi:MAG: hypothetical protein U0J83_05065 [Bulleidia sp.]|nr:hypothetical protein [Bulleidia sp.]
MTKEEFETIILFKKNEFHTSGWNALDINAGTLVELDGDSKEDIVAAVDAMKACMLEGDCYLNDPGKENRYKPELTVRYYCDNLSDDRRKYMDLHGNN